MARPLAAYQRPRTTGSTSSDLAAKEIEQIDHSIAAARDARRHRREGTREPGPADRERPSGRRLHAHQVHQPGAVPLAGRADLRRVLPELQARLRPGQAGRALLPLRARLTTAATSVRLLGQPEEGTAVRREAAARSAAARGGLPGAEPPRVRTDQARLASPARPARAGQAARDRPLLLQPAGGDLRPRLPRPLLPEDQVGELDAAVRRGTVHHDLLHTAAAQEQRPRQYAKATTAIRATSTTKAIPPTTRFVENKSPSKRSRPAEHRTTAACSN